MGKMWDFRGMKYVLKGYISASNAKLKETSIVKNKEDPNKETKKFGNSNHFFCLRIDNFFQTYCYYMCP